MKCRYRAALVLSAALSAFVHAQPPPESTATQQPSAIALMPTPAQGPTTSADGAYSAAGLYNLANSYARAGKPGMAILNYERAALLAPEDADIQANLNYERSTLHLPPQARGALDSVAHLAGPTTVASIGLLGVLAALASLIAFKIAPRHRALWIAATCSSFAAIGFTVCNAIYWGPKTHEAVVIASTTPIRATPVPMGDTLQDLAEAQTVTIIQGHEDFVLIRTPSGRSGWVSRADLADVVPKIAVR